MIGEGCDFKNTADMLTKYFSLDELPVVEERLFEHPTRKGKFPGPRNEKGYRSDPFDERGDINIAFLGCSWVEGSGVQYDEIFTSRVKAKLQVKTGRKVMCWNLGLAAMGMDYLVRIAPSVCNVLQPDLVVVIATWADRKEHFTGDGKRIALYDPVPILVRNGRLNVSDAERELVLAYETLASDYQDLTSHIQSFAALEGIFTAAQIPWVYSWIDMPKAVKAIGQMSNAGLLPEENYLGHVFTRMDDAGPTNKHPGPLSHDQFADVVVSWVEQSGLLADERVADPSPPKRWVRKTLQRLVKPGKQSDAIEDDGDDIYPLW